MTCILCKARQVTDPAGYCSSCTIDIRLEAAAGIRRLMVYLAAWAAFRDWLDQLGSEA